MISFHCENEAKYRNALFQSVVRSVGLVGWLVGWFVGYFALWVFAHKCVRMWHAPDRTIIIISIFRQTNDDCIICCWRIYSMLCIFHI